MTRIPMVLTTDIITIPAGVITAVLTEAAITAASMAADTVEVIAVGVIIDCEFQRTSGILHGCPDTSIRRA